VPPAPPGKRDTGRREQPLQPDARASRANQLINRLIDLHATAAYLQDVLLRRSEGIGIQLDPETDYEALDSLNRLYESDDLKTVDVGMYNQLLDAAMAALRVELRQEEHDEPSSMTVSPQQSLDIERVLGAFEDALTEQGDFKYQLPVLLRDLKADQVIFEEMSDGLQAYPILSASDLYRRDENLGEADQPNPIELAGEAVYGQAERQIDRDIRREKSTGPDAALLDEVSRQQRITDQLPETPEEAETLDDPDSGDISPGLYEDINERLDLYEKYYAATYNLATGIDSAYLGVRELANTFFYRPLHDVMLAVSMLSALKAFFHKPRLSQLKGALSMLVFPRLISGLVKFSFMIDRLLNKAAWPLARVLDSLGRFFSQLRRIGNDAAWVLDGGLTGAIRAELSGKRKQSMPDPKQLEELNKVPDAIRTVSANLHWAQNSVQAKHLQIQASLVRAVDRRLGDQGDRLEVLKTLRSIDAVVSVLTSLGRSIQAYRGAPNRVLQDHPVEVFSRAVRDFRSEANLVFRVDGSTIIATPPAIPEPPGRVKTILTRGGAEPVNSGDFLIRI